MRIRRRGEREPPSCSPRCRVLIFQEALLEYIIPGNLITSLAAVMHTHRMVGSLRMLEVVTTRALERHMKSGICVPHAGGGSRRAFHK